MGDQQRTTTIWDVQPGDGLDISDVTVRVVHKSGKRARLIIEAPKGAHISRRHDESECIEAAPSLVS